MRGIGRYKRCDRCGSYGVNGNGMIARSLSRPSTTGAEANGGPCGLVKSVKVYHALIRYAYLPTPTPTLLLRHCLPTYFGLHKRGVRATVLSDDYYYTYVSRDMQGRKTILCIRSRRYAVLGLKLYNIGTSSRWTPSILRRDLTHNSLDETR